MTDRNRGEPGEPGLPGIDGGGPGGAGGRGGDAGGIGGTSTGLALQKGLRRLAWTTIALFVTIVLVGGWLKVDSIRQDKELSRQATVAKQVALNTRQLAIQNHEATCAVAKDLKRRAENTKKVLQNNPNGVLGFNKVAILNDLKNQMRTANILSKTAQCEEINDTSP